jgi:hypothetical protein
LRKSKFISRGWERINNAKFNFVLKKLTTQNSLTLLIPRLVVYLVWNNITLNYYDVRADVWLEKMITKQSTLSGWKITVQKVK